MTNSEIEAFLAVIHYGTLSAAAEHLFVTQPALSRRMKSLEEEIGYRLFQRRKGSREISLTREGEEFLAVAGKWKSLWEEIGAISGKERHKKLNLASVESVSSYIFPNVFGAFLAESAEYHLTFHQYHSGEAYGYVEKKMTDLAFVSDQRYARALKIRPAFSEPFVLAGAAPAGQREEVAAEELDPAGEIRLPWSIDFDQWHIRHFADNVYPRVFLDQMSLMENFLTEDAWAIVPVTVGYKLREQGVSIRKLKDAPPDRMIYYLVHEENDNPLIGRFLYHLDEYLHSQESVDSYLRVL